MFRFTGLLPEGARSGRALEAVTGSFRTLSPAERQEARQRRIEVVPVGGGESVASLSRRMAVEKAPEERFRVLNDLAPGAATPPGSRVKLVR
jgi:predicted Zn-dependent protease